MIFNLSLPSIFGRRNTIENVSADVLRNERISLQNEERKISKDLSRLSGDRERLVQEYAVAREMNDAQQQRCIARRFDEIKDQQKALDGRHAHLTKCMRMLNFLMHTKEREAFLKRIGSRVLNMDLVELQAYVERSTDQAELTAERMDILLDTVDEAAERAHGTEDIGLDSTMKELDVAADRLSAGAGQPVLASAGLDAAIQGIDRELAARSSARIAASQTEQS